MNRSCPNCQNDQAQTWLAKERKRLINVPYFFVTFTLPEELRGLARSNQRLFYRLMFAVAWQAMKKLAYEPRLIGGLIGALAVLHTWSRTLIYHPHIHFLVTAGGLDEDLDTSAEEILFTGKGPVQNLSRQNARRAQSRSRRTIQANPQTGLA